MEHRRPDGEVVGYIEMLGELFRPYDLAGRPIGEATQWNDAEDAVEQLGLAWLAEPYLVDVDGERRVRVTEIDREQIVFVADEFGASQAVGAAALERWVLTLPLTLELRPIHTRHA